MGPLACGSCGVRAEKSTPAAPIQGNSDCQFLSCRAYSSSCQWPQVPWGPFGSDVICSLRSRCENRVVVSLPTPPIPASSPSLPQSPHFSPSPPIPRLSPRCSSQKISRTLTRRPPPPPPFFLFRAATITSSLSLSRSRADLLSLAMAAPSLPFISFLWRLISAPMSLHSNSGSASATTELKEQDGGAVESRSRTAAQWSRGGRPTKMPRDAALPLAARP